MSTKGWNFEGSDGCDICQDATGWYESEPSRPHANCDCEIIDLTDELEDLDFEGCNSNEEDIYIEIDDMEASIGLVSEVENDVVNSVSYSCSFDSANYESEIQDVLEGEETSVRNIDHATESVDEDFDGAATPIISLVISVSQEICYDSDNEIIKDDVRVSMLVLFDWDIL